MVQRETTAQLVMTAISERQGLMEHRDCKEKMVPWESRETMEQLVEKVPLDHQDQSEERKYVYLASNTIILVILVFFIQINIYETFDDLMMSCDDDEAPPTTGCLAFVRNTRFIYVQMPGEECDWQAWVSVLLY